MDAAAPASQLVYCGIKPLRRTYFPSKSTTRIKVRSTRSNKVLAVATDPETTATQPSKSSTPKIIINGSSKSPPSIPVNGASTRMSDVSQEIKRVRAQMEENEQVAILMRGLRGQNLSDSQFADNSIQLRLVEVDESSEFLPLAYDPATISAYWGKRPRAVATRIVQLLSVAGGFLSRLAWDVIKKKVKEVNI